MTYPVLPERAISLTGPWWWLMLHLPEPWRKSVENRSHGFSWKSFRGPVWVHAAKSVTQAQYDDALTFALEAGVPRDLLQHCPGFGVMDRGGIVGRFTITDQLSDPRDEYGLVPSVPPNVHRWRMLGNFGFLTTEARVVPFTPCRGAQGFFRVPPAVLEQLGKAVA